MVLYLYELFQDHGYKQEILTFDKSKVLRESQEKVYVSFCSTV